jgi:cytochrome P450
VLSNHPELLVRLRQEPTLIPRFVEEVLRSESPVQGVLRVTREEATLGGMRLPQGARVLMLLGSANRDEAHFPEPDRFSLERSGGSPPLAFGQGIHFCLGAQLARLETRLALETLLPQCSKLAPGAEPLDWNMSITVRGPTRLPLEVVS